MALNRVWIPSPNYSSRGGTKVRLVVVHTAEGSRNFRDLGAFFANPASQVSSQTGIDDTPGQIGEYVKRDAKPWTQGNANPYSTATELCAFAKWDAAEWSRHPVMLDNCRQWIAEECAYFGIPMVKLTAAQAQGGQAGVCGHVDLGAAGGGHWDPGPDFPWSQVLGPSPIPPTPEDDLPLNDADKKFITDTVNQQLRSLFAPDAECFNRVVQADQKAIQQTPANVPK